MTKRNTKTAPLIGGLQLDPIAAEQYRRSATTNRAALTDKQKSDRKRTSLRVDCPRWLKDLVADRAAAEDVSISQMAAFLLAWALDQHARGNTDLVEQIADNKTLTRSLNAKYALSLEALQERLDTGADNCTDSADALKLGQNWPIRADTSADINTDT